MPLSIPRAPIPTPDSGVSRRKSLKAKKKSAVSDSDSAVHYEVLPDLHRRQVTTSSGEDNTFDSIEIPMASGSSNGGDVKQSMHYKVLHDREGHYSYAYDTSMSPAFLIR